MSSSSARGETDMYHASCTQSKSTLGLVRIGLGILMMLLVPDSVWAGPDVTVVNPGSNPVQARDVDNPAFQPFQASVVASFNSPTVVYVVPAGKRLVVEFFSSEIFAASPTRYFVSVAADPTQPGNVLMTHFFPPPSPGIAIASPIRLYVAPGQALVVNPAGNATGNCCFISITGYLVNLP